MAERLTAIRARFGDAWEAAQRRSFWLVVPVATAAVVGVAGVVGSTALLRADAWRIRTNEIRATGATVAAWREELVRPAPAESAAWARSERAVRSRAIAGGDRFALMQTVAQRAEDMGLGTVSVGFVAADTLGIDVFREVGDRIFDPASYAMEVRLQGDYESVAGFIGGLPPQVDVHRLTVTGRDAGLEAALLLVVFVDPEA